VAWKSKQARPTVRGASLLVAVYLILEVVVITAAEQAGDYLGAVIAGMVQTGKPEAAFEGLQQGKVSIEGSVFHAVCAVVGINDEENLIGGGRHAVVIFVPENHDGIAAVVPDGGAMDGLHDVAQSQVADVHQCGVEADQRSIVVGVEVALRAAVGAAMLIGALIGRDKREVGHMA